MHFGHGGFEVPQLKSIRVANNSCQFSFAAKLQALSFFGLQVDVPLRKVGQGAVDVRTNLVGLSEDIQTRLEYLYGNTIKQADPGNDVGQAGVGACSRKFGSRIDNRSIVDQVTYPGILGAADSKGLYTGRRDFGVRVVVVKISEP